MDGHYCKRFHLKLNIHENKLIYGIIRGQHNYLIISSISVTCFIFLLLIVCNYVNKVVQEK